MYEPVLVVLPYCTKSKAKRKKRLYLYCFQAELSTLGQQSWLVVCLTVLLSAALVVITLLSLHIARHRIMGLRRKMELLELPSRSDMIRSRTRVSVEDLVGADFNQLYHHTDTESKS